MSRVVVVKLKTPGNRDRPDQTVWRSMLETGLNHLAGAERSSHAVSKWLRPGTVGMKTNCLTGRFNSTSPALVAALGGILEQAGFADNDIVVWERTSRELADADFELNASGRGRRCLGTDANGVGYSREFYSSGPVNSLVSRILTESVEQNINLPVLKDHSIAGLSGGLKNMYGAIHNPNKFHDDNCNPFCAHVNLLEPIRRKNRLTIMDAFRVQYDGGPGYLSQYMAAYGGLILSDDPVAADRVGLEIVESLRAKNGRPPLSEVGREVKYLRTAHDLGLGQADLDDIEVEVAVLQPDGSVKRGELL